MKTQTKRPISLIVTGLSVLLLLCTAVLTAPVQAAAPTVGAGQVPVYTNDFEGAVGAEWSPASTSVTPSGRGFMGEFGAETVTLTLNDLPLHVAVTLSFDFYAIRTWDGNQEFNEEGELVGPDFFNVSVVDGPTLLHTTFANNPDLQAYPGAYPVASYPAHSGASEINTLGYVFFEEETPFDAVYKLHFTFAHAGDALQVQFSGIGLQALADESWGLDNVVVRLAEQTTVYAETFEGAAETVWGPTRYDITPTGRRFLGQFGAEPVTLTLSDLPAHEEVTLAFDLYLIRTWDGNVDPDIFDVSVNGGPTLLHTTFTNNTGVNYQPQAYPDTYPGADNPPYTGVSEVGALGYLPFDAVTQDAVYRLRFTFAHSGPVLQVNFAGIGLQAIEDESWGLDNVVVNVDGTVAYANNFEGTPWPVTRTDRTPSGRGFLGQFGAETLILALDNLPPHSEVTLAFDFYAIATWDGNDDYWGPDIFDLRVEGGPTLLHTTFANADLPQAYPGSYPEASNPRQSGANEVNTLGYPVEGWMGDAVYKFNFTFPHTGSALRIYFAGIGLQELPDERWGLDNVAVHADVQAVYANDFETAAPSIWSKTVQDVTPSGRGFLGQFGAETVTLALADLPAHSYVTLAFDFYAIQTWDGSQEFNQWGTPVGPDIFDLSIGDGPTLLHTTFSNTEYGGLPGDQWGPYLQAYPGAYPGASYAPGAGASAIDMLGYAWDGDAVYKLNFTFPHTGNDLQVNFAVSGTDDSEGWGLDNVKVVVRNTPAPQLFVSSHSSARAGDVAFRDEDIVAYDFGANTWRMVFDGSDVGITKDVDAFAFRPDGSLLLSFNGPTNVPGLGQVDDSDIVQFMPTQLGSDTAGSFVWVLHGADVGLTTDGEDIDAIGFTADGQLIVSTIGDFNTPTASGRDEDLFRLDNATLGTPSSGVWQLFFDGSQVGLANEDVNGLWIDTATGELYLTVKDSFAFSNVAIDSDDIFVCTPAQGGACTYWHFWDSDGHDYGAENLDGIGLGTPPPSFVASVQASDTTASTADELAVDADSDDLNLEELSNQIFLPVIKR